MSLAFESIAARLEFEQPVAGGHREYALLDDIHDLLNSSFDVAHLALHRGANRFLLAGATIVLLLESF